MIHELIDSKKKLVRSNGTKGGKNFGESSTKLYCDQNTNHFDQSDNENKGASSTSNTFIPPWLKNSLGLNQKNKQSHAVSDQKSTKIFPRHKEEDNNETENFRRSLTTDCMVRVSRDLENSLENCLADVNDCLTVGVSPIDCVTEKAANLSWSNARKEFVSESMLARSKIKLANRENYVTTEPNINVKKNNENERLKDEDVRKPKPTKPKSKMKKFCIKDEPNGHLMKNGTNGLLVDVRTKGDLDTFSPKEGISVNVGTKQLETKIISLGVKCREADPSKLSHQEFRLLQDIKERIGNKEEFKKFMGQLCETKLKEWLTFSDGFLKMNGEKIKLEEIKNVNENFQNQKELIEIKEGAVKEAKINSDKDSLRSTDEENDIKRFSEFLSKNKNVDEKRKCLEEVRNYFERKRRTRLTKRRFYDESKISKPDDGFSFLAKKDDFPRERPATSRDVTTVYSAKERKTKFVPCNEEVVEKAVSETLQKFMSLYHFHVSPTMMGSMRKNILEAIQSDSLESSSSKKKLSRERDTSQHQHHPDVKKPIKNLGNSVSGCKENERQIPDPCGPVALDMNTLVGFKSMCANHCKDFKKSSFRTLVEDTKIAEQDIRLSREKDVLENENFKRLKREFENCLKSVQYHADGTGLKIQSLVLEKEETSASKGIRFVYNFSKKSLEFIQLDCEQNKTLPRSSLEKDFNKTSKDEHTQTVFKFESNKKSTKCQTTELTRDVRDTREQSLQTDEKSFATNCVQTETEEFKEKMKEVKALKDFNISPGLYRMVKSKNIGRFYLYPEKKEEMNARVHPSNGTICHSECISEHCDDQTKVEPDEPKKYIRNEKSVKELKIFYKNKRTRKDVKKIKKKISMNSAPRKQPPEEGMESKIDSSVSCLFFRNSKRDSRGYWANGHQIKANSVENDEVESEKIEDSACTEDRFGCFWFWNGEKIGPGCDLKTHVENLLEEKLKKINENPTKAAEVELFGTSDEKNQDVSQVVKKRIWEKDPTLVVQNSRALFCFRNDALTRSNVDSQSVDNHGKDEKQKHKKPSMANPEKRSNNEEKGLRNAGPQNPQHRKARFKANTSSKVNGRRWKKVASAQDSKGVKGEVLGLKALANFVKAVRELRRLQTEADDEKGPSPESSFRTDDSTTTSETKNATADLHSLILKSKPETETSKNKIAKTESSGNQCSTTQTSEGHFKKSSVEKWERHAEDPGYKHWELIEKVLNRVSLKEREGLWNDIRQFIKKKIGRDINEEGAREVCIEIEQDMPNIASGKMQREVMARGHYIRNEGDVEVEIDLTLDDLEKILRQRHRKMRRRHRHIWNSTKAKKLFSSSSAQSGLTRKESRGYRPSSMDLL